MSYSASTGFDRNRDVETQLIWTLYWLNLADIDAVNVFAETVDYSWYREI